MTRVDEPAQFRAAFEAAFEASDSVMVESFLDGREFTCGVIPSTPGGPPRFLPVTEIISDNAFFDYEAKYAGKSREVTPADIDVDLTSDIQERAVTVYRDSGLQRNGAGRLHSPRRRSPTSWRSIRCRAFSEISIIPQQAQVVGISPTELISLILDDALMGLNRI